MKVCGTKPPPKLSRANKPERRRTVRRERSSGLNLWTAIQKIERINQRDGSKHEDYTPEQKIHAAVFLCQAYRSMKLCTSGSITAEATLKILSA